MLFIGLRAPSLDSKAYILRASLADLFAAGHAPSVAVPEVIPVELGPQTANIGIRDLARFNDQLVLAGPAQEQDDVSYSLFMVEPRAGKPTPVASLPDLIKDGKRMKAESVTILDAQGGTLRLLICSTDRVMVNPASIAFHSRIECSINSLGSNAMDPPLSYAAKQEASSAARGIRVLGIHIATVA